jgi:hypothetical protein
MHSKADLHVHSKYSCRPSEWILRRIGAPESFVEPEEVYRRAKAADMDFVTISDHNCIDGALEISHHADTFLSTELTTYFPENRCKIHCLVSGITETQFADMQGIRENIYDLREYVQTNNIVHTIAHPLFAINDRLDVDLIEKLLVMFNRFEAINGTRYPRANELLTVICRHLTPELISDMANKHELTPFGDEPWKKTLTGGSDDHSGLYVASAYTKTPPVDSPEEFLEHLRAGRHDKGGKSGSSLKLAHSLYLIAYSYYKNRFLDHDSSGKPNLLGGLLQKLIETPPEKKTTDGPIKRFATRIIRPWKTRKLSSVERSLVTEFTRLFDKNTLDSLAEGEQALDRRSFQMACRISQELGCSFLKQFINRVQSGKLVESLQTLSSLGPVAFSIAPYFTAFRTQHKDEPFLQGVARRFDNARHLIARSRHKAWIADSVDADSELDHTVRSLAEDARREGRELTVLTCLQDPPAIETFGYYNFNPVDVFDVPDHPNLRLAFPPFLEVIEYLERHHISELVISTPGPLGLNAVMAAKLLGLKTVGLYQTDFRDIVRKHTEDDEIAQLAWKYMCWFYGQMDTVFVQNAELANRFRESGFEHDQVRVMSLDADASMFIPEPALPYPPLKKNTPCESPW